MASNQVLSAILQELEQLKKIPFAELTVAVENGKDFYGEGEISVPEKDGRNV